MEYGGKEINRPLKRRNYNLANEHWSDRCADDDVQVEILVCKRTKKKVNK